MNNLNSEETLPVVIYLSLLVSKKCGNAGVLSLDHINERTTDENLRWLRQHLLRASVWVVFSFGILIVLKTLSTETVLMDGDWNPDPDWYAAWAASQISRWISSIVSTRSFLCVDSPSKKFVCPFQSLNCIGGIGLYPRYLGTISSYKHRVSYPRSQMTSKSVSRDQPLFCNIIWDTGPSRIYRARGSLSVESGHSGQSWGKESESAYLFGFNLD